MSMRYTDAYLESLLAHKRLVGGWFDAVQRNVQIVRNVVSRENYHVFHGFRRHFAPDHAWPEKQSPP